MWFIQPRKVKRSLAITDQILPRNPNLTHFLQNAAAAVVAAAAAAAEDLRFGGCGEKFGRYRQFLVVFGIFSPFSDVFDRFRTFWGVFGAKLQKLLIAETVSTRG